MIQGNGSTLPGHVQIGHQLKREVKSTYPDGRSKGSNSCQFMLTGQNWILSVQPSGIPPGQDTLRLIQTFEADQKDNQTVRS